MNKKIALFMIILILAASLAGCESAAGAKPVTVVKADISRAWIDFPMNNTQLPMGEYELVSHAADNGGIAQVEWSINSEVLAVVSAGNAVRSEDNLFEFRTKWTPAEPGEYTIQTRAQSNAGNWTGVSKVKVTILGKATSTPTISPTPTLTPTITFTPTLTETPTITPTESIGLELVDMTRSSDELFYGSCTPNEITFTVRATQPDQVKYMFFFYRLQDRESGEKTENNDGLPMDQVSEDTWSITLKATQLENYNKFDGAWFIYQFVSQGPDKTLTRSKASGDLPYSSCENGGDTSGVVITPFIFDPGE